MPLFGQIAALGTAVCWTFTAIFFSYSGRRIGSEVVNRSRLLFAFLFLSLTHLLIEGTIFPFEVEPFRWGWLALSGLLGLVLGDSFLFQAYVLIGPRLSMLMMSMVPILSTFLARVFLSERVELIELMGILVTVMGIAWVVTEKQGEKTIIENKDYSRGLTFGFLGALGQASGLIAVKFGLADEFSTISATLIRILVALVSLWILAAIRGRVSETIRSWHNRPAFWALLGGTVVGPFLGVWLSLVAVQLAPVGIAATLMALPPIIIIPVNYILYREGISRRSGLGTVLAFTGVGLILLPA